MSLKLTSIIKELIHENSNILLPKRDIFEGFDETVLQEDYPQGFDLNEFKNIRSYAGKVRYATEQLGKPLGQGTSRVVFRVDNTKVLKLAKNKKGIAQNTVEIDWGRQTYYDDIIAKVFDTDFYDYYWVEMELATKASAKDFKRLWNVDNTNLYYYLDNRNNENKNLRKFYRIPQEIEDELDNNEYVGN